MKFGSIAGANNGRLRIMTHGLRLSIVTLLSALWLLPSAFGFEGRVTVAITRGGEVQNVLYTAGTNFLRIECLDTNWPHARDIVNLQGDELTLLFPHNRSFVRLNSQMASPARPQFPSPGQPGTPPQMPAMPMMPPPPAEKMELTKVGGTTNILGFTCVRYELKQRGQTMEIWATEQLFPYRPYLENQPHHAGLPMIEEQWGKWVAEKNMFPLMAVLKLQNGAERYRFEAKSVTPEKVRPEDETKLFAPPPGYQEIQPLPF